jgi:hypothetical protein
MQVWYRRRGCRATAAAARQITGISVPFGEIQWADPGPSDRQIVPEFVDLASALQSLD